MEHLDKEILGANGEKKRIREIIDPKKDFFARDGKGIITHTGIRKMKRFVGAKWTSDPLVVETPTKDNDFGFYLLCSTEFPDGEICKEAGEANNLNATKNISREYKFTMALKRGRDRSFLRSDYIGLDDLLSDSEIDNMSGEGLGQEDPDPKSVKLPFNDEKYPGEPVSDVWAKHKDKAYLEALKTYDNPVLTVRETELVRWVAEGILEVMERKRAEKKRAEALKEAEAAEAEEGESLPQPV